MFHCGAHYVFKVLLQSKKGRKISDKYELTL